MGPRRRIGTMSPVDTDATVIVTPITNTMNVSHSTVFRSLNKMMDSQGDQKHFGIFATGRVSFTMVMLLHISSPRQNWHRFAK